MQQDISWPISLKNEGYDFSYKPRDSLTPTLIFITLSARFCCCGSKSLPLWSVTLEVISSSFWDFEACCCLHSWFRGQWSLRRWTELFHNRPSVMSRWGGQYTQSTIIMGGWIGVMVNRDYTINFFFSVLCGRFFVIKESSEKDISLADVPCPSFPGSFATVSKWESSRRA